MDISDRFQWNYNIASLGMPDVLPNITYTRSFDANGDGITDILAATDNYGDDSTDYSAYLLLGDANGGFSIGAQLPGRYVPRDAAVGDLNGDGDMDFYVAYTGPDTAEAPGEKDVLMMSDGTGGWTAVSFPNPATGFSHSVAIGDIDDDDDLDIFVQTNGDEDNAQPFLLINDGSGSFTLDRSALPESIATQNDSSSYIRQQWAEFADLNNDGLADLIVGKQEEPGTNPPRKSWIFFNQGGSFDDDHAVVLPDHKKLRNAQEVIDLQAVDLDGDGDLELVMIGQGRRAGEGYTSEFAIQVFEVSDNGKVTDDSARWFGADAGYFSGSQIPYGLNFYDVNGDGRLDIVPQGWSGPYNDGAFPVLLLNGGEGVFQIYDAVDVESDQTYFFGSHTLPTFDNGVLRYVSVDANPETGMLDIRAIELVGDLPEVTTGMYRLGANRGEVMAGQAFDDTLMGRGGDDRIGGRRGDDDLRGGPGADTISGGEGADRLRGDGGNDDLNGDAGRDILLGGAGKDVLKGGTGNDRLRGEAGNDVMRGNAGKDTFVFGAGDDRDRIIDFQDDHDTLKLLPDLGVSNLRQALRHASEVSGNVVFDFGDGDILTVQNITIADLRDDIVIG